MSNADRHEQMLEALKTGLPFVKKTDDVSLERLSIACYGPSLKETWNMIRHPVMAVSGAYDFLTAHGIIPDYYAAADPRRNAIQLRHPQKETVYYIASCCHPDWWDLLDGFHVELWHLINGNDFETINWVDFHHPAGLDSLIGGGSTVGQRAMNVAAIVLGIRKFDIYGMDCSFPEGQQNRHAGPHTGDMEIPIYCQVQGMRYKTTPQLLQCAKEMQEFLQTMEVEAAFYGKGLLPAVARALKERKVKV